MFGSTVIRQASGDGMQMFVAVGAQLSFVGHQT